jgi:hypothetical protein
MLLLHTSTLRHHGRQRCGPRATLAKFEQNFDDSIDVKSIVVLRQQSAISKSDKPKKRAPSEQCIAADHWAVLS